MKVYFYSGKTTVIDGANKLFCGTWKTSQEASPEEALSDIIKMKKEEIGQDNIVITSFNVIT